MKTPDDHLNTGGNVSNRHPRRSVVLQFDHFPIVTLRVSCSCITNESKVRFLSLKRYSENRTMSDNCFLQLYVVTK